MRGSGRASREVFRRGAVDCSPPLSTLGLGLLISSRREGGGGFGRHHSPDAGGLSGEGGSRETPPPPLLSRGSVLGKKTAWAAMEAAGWLARL